MRPKRDKLSRGQGGNERPPSYKKYIVIFESDAACATSRVGVKRVFEVVTLIYCPGSLKDSPLQTKFLFFFTFLSIKVLICYNAGVVRSTKKPFVNNKPCPVASSSSSSQNGAPAISMVNVDKLHNRMTRLTNSEFPLFHNGITKRGKLCRHHGALQSLQLTQPTAE
jgi:hypothetical protein